MKKLVWFWLIAFLAGILISQLMGQTQGVWAGDIRSSLLLLENSRSGDVERGFYIIRERLREVFCILLLMTTKLGKYTGEFLLTLVGLLMGVFSGNCMQAFGWSGIGLAIVAVFPQGLLYGLCYYLLLRERDVYATGFAGMYARKRKLAVVGRIVLIIITLAVGIILEASVGFELFYKAVNAYAFISARV